tara:strand:- start:31 stop:534 length:504 start_codon:yes stop_codon:yes gene_type:complete
MGYQLIETIEVGAGGAASIEFTGIDGTGQDLILQVSARNSDATPTVILGTLNSDTGSNYGSVSLEGNGASPSTSSATLGFWRLRITGSGDTANTFGSGQLYISNYASTTNKSLSGDSVSENNATTAYQRLDAMSYATTSAITSIQAAIAGDNFAEFSTASLYMITAD